MRLFEASPLRVGEVGGTSAPGLLWWDKHKWRMGEEAFHGARLEPQSLRTEPWEQPSLHPLPGTGRDIRHGADLCVAQLRALRLPADQAWGTLVPFSWEQEHIRTFLGVAKELGWNNRWVMPRALAVAVLAEPDADEMNVLEWAWTHLTLNELACADGQWRIVKRSRYVEGGLFKLFRREADAANDRHMREFRIDLLNRAADEQKLFESWWKWHHLGEPWVGGSLVFGEEPRRFSDLHAGPLAALRKYDLPNTRLPSALRHILGWEQAQSDQVDFRAILDLVPEVPGDRIRHIDHVTRPALAPPPLPLPVTHWVVGGIAEAVAGDVAAVPGQHITLSDGRKALAIHVPRPGGTP